MAGTTGSHVGLTPCFLPAGAPDAAPTGDGKEHSSSHAASLAAHVSTPGGWPEQRSALWGPGATPAGVGRAQTMRGSLQFTPPTCACCPSAGVWGPGSDPSGQDGGAGAGRVAGRSQRSLPLLWGLWVEVTLLKGPRTRLRQAASWGDLCEPVAQGTRPVHALLLVPSAQPGLSRRLGPGSSCAGNRQGPSPTAGIVGWLWAVKTTCSPVCYRKHNA